MKNVTNHERKLNELADFSIYLLSYFSTFVDFEFFGGWREDRPRPVTFLVYAIFDALAGYYLLFGTHHLARLVYGETKPNESDLDQIENALKS